MPRKLLYSAKAILTFISRGYSQWPSGIVVRVVKIIIDGGIGIVAGDAPPNMNRSRDIRDGRAGKIRAVSRWNGGIESQVHRGADREIVLTAVGIAKLPILIGEAACDVNCQRRGGRARSAGDYERGHRDPKRREEADSRNLFHWLPFVL